MRDMKLSEFKEEIYDYEVDQLKTKKLVVIDFYADWCQPCKMLNKILIDLEKEVKDVEFVKINAEDVYELTEYFEIKNLPTIIFLDENNREYISGLTSKQNLISKINSLKNNKILA